MGREIKGVISNVKELACYVSKKYEVEYNAEISPLKLQKSLYFLFAFWGGYISKAIKNRNNIETDYTEFSPYLFMEPIEAWMYGPVVPVVYKEKCNLASFFVEKFLEDNKQVKEFIDDLLEQIFKVSDFRLVDITHADNVWKKYFNKQDSTHSKEMPKDEILAEYENKF